MTVHGFAESAAAAKRALKRKLQNRPGRLTAGPEGVFRTVAEQWWTRKLETGRWASTTTATYRPILDRLILPIFGATPAGSITVPAVNRFFDEVVSSTPGHAKHACTLLRQIMRFAVGRGLATITPVLEAELLDMPEPDAPRTLSKSELHRLRHAARIWEKGASTGRTPSIPMSAIIDTALGAGGLRIGEVLSLKWADIDLDTETPTAVIHSTVIKGPAAQLGASTIVQDATKTRRSRVSHLSRIAVTAFQSVPHAHDLVFATTNGTPRSVSNFYRAWGTVCEIAGLGDATFHSLRRTVGTRIDQEMGLQVAARVLGDESALMVNKHYVARAQLSPDATHIIDSLVDHD